MIMIMQSNDYKPFDSNLDMVFDTILATSVWTKITTDRFIC